MWRLKLTAWFAKPLPKTSNSLVWLKIFIRNLFHLLGIAHSLKFPIHLSRRIHPFLVMLFNTFRELIDSIYRYRVLVHVWHPSDCESVNLGSWYSTKNCDVYLFSLLGFRYWLNLVIKTRVVNFFIAQVVWCKKLGFRNEIFVLPPARPSPTVLTWFVMKDF